METLEFFIHADGRVEERVSGIFGSKCAQVTASIEAKLGIVAQRELTSENFAPNLNFDANLDKANSVLAVSDFW